MPRTVPRRVGIAAAADLLELLEHLLRQALPPRDPPTAIARAGFAATIDTLPLPWYSLDRSFVAADSRRVCMEGECGKYDDSDEESAQCTHPSVRLSVCLSVCLSE